ncbi:GAF domain-containing sensor histidine kinase [Christiangramia sp.]|uniref:sensor histidine kinase n=1 Tax=Christiangramia sp. TaxID=1931228 RepID=UPI002619F5BE|nr:GAF domain-containing sensor histidine kinase [Christiangramia sp.]
MLTPNKPLNEERRLKGVRQLGLLNSLPQETFDNITTLAREICKSSIALLTILDEEKQWFKSKKGFSEDETARDISFCGHAILEPNSLFEVENALEDERFQDNPLVASEEMHFRSYAGVPILNKDGLAMGTLCVINKKEKKLSINQKKSLIALGKQVEILYETHLKNEELKQIRKEQEETNKMLKQFASNVSHDLKMPLANIILTTDMLKAKYKDSLDDQGLDYLNYIKKSGLTLSQYITSILEYYSKNKEDLERVESFFLNDLLEDIIDILRIDSNCEINFPEKNLKIIANKASIEQVMLNLISNSLKYNSNEKTLIDIHCKEDHDYYHFGIKDNGIGIPHNKLDTIFELFSFLKTTDPKGNKSHGIGLSTVKKLVESMEGTISVKSKMGEGTLFEFSVKQRTENSNLDLK